MVLSKLTLVLEVMVMRLDEKIFLRLIKCLKVISVHQNYIFGGFFAPPPQKKEIIHSNSLDVTLHHCLI